MISYDTDTKDIPDSYREKFINPTIGRRYSLVTPNPRIRSNSIAVYNDDNEDDVVFTSYGPVVVEEETRGNVTNINNES